MEVFDKGILKSAESSIHKAYKQHRLVFLGSDLISYQSKTGEVKEYSFDGMAKAFLDVTGQREHLAMFGLGEPDIRNIIDKIYKEAK